MTYEVLSVSAPWEHGMLYAWLYIARGPGCIYSGDGKGNLEIAVEPRVVRVGGRERVLSRFYWVARARAA